MSDKNRAEPQPGWLEVSLTVNGELAEAVAEVLARFAPGGVVTEQAVEYTDDEGEGTPVGPITVRAYLPWNEALQETRRKLEEALYYLGRIQPLPTPRFTPIGAQNWMEAWKQHYRPIPVGKRLVIVPAWLDVPSVERVAVRIDPGMAFGTGTHPTTQLCLELMEEVLQETGTGAPGAPASFPVLDIGCGSGILSIAALKLGATIALGVDIDEMAIRAARQNARLNAISDERLLLGVGSVREIRAGNFPISRAPLVLANILAPVIIRLFADGLARLVAAGGSLILSGILVEQGEAVLTAARAEGLTLQAQRQQEDWVALRLTI